MTRVSGAVEQAVERVRHLLGAQQWEGALRELRPLMRQMPRNARIWAAVGESYFRLQRYAEALPAYRQAVALEPGTLALRYSFAATLHKELLFEEAVVEYQRVLAQSPEHRAARSQLGAALLSLGRMDEARSVLEECLIRFAEHAPEMRFVKTTLGTCYLQQGDYARGWPLYENRNPWEHFPDPSTPVWRGEACESLRIQAEQGFGDTFQFLRFVSLAAARARRVTLAVQSALVPLIAGSFSRDASMGHVEVVGADSPSDGSPWVRLMSLPCVLELGGNVGAHRGAYLTADPSRVEFFAENSAREDPSRVEFFGENSGARRLPDSSRVELFGENSRPRPLRVGLAWQGRASYSMDRLRSLPTEVLAPLADAKGVRFMILQQGATSPFSSRNADEWCPPGDFDARGAFVDTAALISTLDLVVSSDTAMAHLAGALGRPVLVMLGHVSEWRWGHTSPRTDWYSGAILLRQDTPGDWASVIAKVAGELSSRCRVSPAP